MTILLWWGLIFGLCILLELSSPGFFYFLSFACGALGALSASWIGSPPVIASGVFLATTGIAFVLLRNYARSLVEKKVVFTNVDALRGKSGVVLAQITPLERGWVKVEGETWGAKPLGDEVFDIDAIIQVVTIEGSHLIVQRKTM